MFDIDVVMYTFSLKEVLSIIQSAITDFTRSLM
jgi:hypothetical protein